MASQSWISGQALGWRFQFLHQWSEVESSQFLDRWRSAIAQALARRGGASIYQHPGFVLTWSRILSKTRGIKPLLGFASDGNGNQLFLPWVVVSERGKLLTRRVLEHAGSFMTGYTDPLLFAGDEASVDWGGFWRASQLVCAPWCDLARIRFVRKARAGEWHSVVHLEATPVLNLIRHGNVTEWQASCSRKYRYDVARNRRRLESLAPLRFRVHSAEEARDVRQDIRARFLPAHSDISRTKGFSDPFAPEDMKEWLIEVCTLGISEGWCIYVTLCLGDNPIAWVIGFLLDGEFFYWRPTYSLQWKAYSPGKVLLFMLIEYAFSQGWKAIHLHTGDQAYKLSVRPELADMNCIQWRSPTFRGSILGAYDKARAALWEARIWRNRVHLPEAPRFTLGTTETTEDHTDTT